ncbi:MAG: protein kinase [Alphaproteobacteria bacterium]|nr:protein kinase [Alphaproteobacteria bacterium]
MEEGDRIDGWVVEARLGAGGMGSVYRCRSAATDRIVAAIKVLEVNLRQNPEAGERFVREAAIVAGLDHPNIVRVRNVRTEADPPYIEMDFVEGRSLDALARQGPMPYVVARRYLLQVADALAYLHARGVRHRDLKPANVLVDAQDRVKLVDFGLATDSSMERITQEGISFGTVSYAPPEWMDPDRLDPVQWDLYAVGVIFHELVTGTVAFPMSGEGPLKKQLLQVMMRKQTSPPLDPGESFPDELRELIHDLTCLDIEDRIPDANVLLDRVRKLPEASRPREVPTGPEPSAGDEATVPVPERREEATPSPPPSEVATLPPTTSRASAVVAALGLSVLGAAMIGAGAWWTMLPPPPPPTRPVAPVPLPLPESVTTRPVVVRFTGIPESFPTRVTIGGRTVEAVDGVARFDAVTTKDTEAVWVSGHDCEECPGDACPSWCGSGRMPVQAGEGKAELTAIGGSGRGTVVVKVPAIAASKKKKRWPLAARLDSYAMTPEGASSASLSTVLPGRHHVFVDIGSCSEEHRGCWPDGKCPDKCRSVVREVVVPWEGGRRVESISVVLD